MYFLHKNIICKVTERSVKMKKNFTLIELLVVIAIIAILAGMIMPALGHARAAGTRTDCLNNKKQLITSMLMYSQSYSGIMVYKSTDKGGAVRPYSYFLAGKENAGVNAYLPEKSLLCTTVKTNATIDTVANTNTVGMINDITDIIGGDTDNIGYVVEKIKNPNGLVIFADAFKKLGASDQEQARCSFDPNKDDANDLVGIVHLSETTVACADGSAAAVSAPKLADYDIHYTLDSTFETVSNDGK